MGSSLLRYFILPHNGQSTLGEFTAKELHWNSPVEMPLLAPYVLDHEDDRLVFLRNDAPVEVRGLFSGAIQTRELDLAALGAPPKFSGVSIALRQGVLFVGGRSGTDNLFLLDLDAPKLRLQEVPLPAHVRATGKSIDCLAIAENELFVFDDLIAPKWVVAYEIENPRAPVLKRVVQLFPGIGEWKRAVVGEEWIAIFSSGLDISPQDINPDKLFDDDAGNEYRLSSRVQLLRRSMRMILQGNFERLDEGTVGGSGPVYRGGKELAYVFFEDLDLFVHRLMLAAGKHGIAVLELPKELPREPYFSRPLCKSAAQLEWQSVPEGSVKRVRALTYDTALAVVENNGALDTILVQLRPAYRKW